MRRYVWIACVVAGCSSGHEVEPVDATVGDTAVADVEADADANANADASAEADASADADASAEADAHGDADTSADAVADADASADAVADADVGADADASADAVADADASADADGDADAVADADADAGGPSVLGTVARPRGIAAGGGYVFVTSFLGAIQRLPASGGVAVPIAAPTWPTYVSVDSTHVYWTDMGASGSPGTGRVGRVAIAGGAEQILASSLEVPNSNWLFGGRVYFAQSRVTVGTFGSAFNVPVAGGSTTLIAAMQPDAYYVAANATHVCWAALTQLICRREGVIEPLVTGEPTRIMFVALDEANAYYIAGPLLRRVPLTGGTPVTIDTNTGTGMIAIGDIALDATHVYWSYTSQVRKVPKSGGTGAPLYTGTSDVTGIAIDATHVYWASFDDFVRKLPK